MRFVDEEPDKRKNEWKLNDRWAWFIGDNRQSLKLTTKPEPYTLDRTLRWVQRQVAPTLKMLKKIDKGNGTDYMETIEQQAKLTEKHEMIIKQQTTPAKDLLAQAICHECDHLEGVLFVDKVIEGTLEYIDK